MTPYKLKSVQLLKGTDKLPCRDFCIAMQEKLADLTTGLLLAMRRTST